MDTGVDLGGMQILQKIVWNRIIKNICPFEFPFSALWRSQGETLNLMLEPFSWIKLPFVFFPQREQTSGSQHPDN